VDPAPSLTHIELQQSLGTLADTGRSLDALLATLDDAQVRWKPAADRWSVGECVEHMAMTTEKLLPILRAAIEKGKSEGRRAQGPFRYGWTARFFVNSLAPDNKRRYKVPAIYAPTAAPETMTTLGVREHWHRVHNELAELIGSADGLDLKGIKAVSPATSLIRLPVGAWFQAMIFHNERHLGQARRVVQTPGFPQAPVEQK